MINRTGKRNGFTPVDQGQEQNIKDNKVTYRSMGPGTLFEYIRKMSPAIPTLRAVKERVRSQFASLLARGKHHGKPSKDADVAALIGMYRTSKMHTEERGRTVKNTDLDRAKDYVTMGAGEIFSGQVIERWWTERDHDRATDDIQEHASVNPEQ